MWPGPYGQGGGSRKYLLASLDQCLRRVGLDYFDIFYSHRFDPDTPLEETMGALDAAVRQGKALYVGISSYSAGKTREAAAILRASGRAAADPPAALHPPQPLGRGRACSMRWRRSAPGCIAFTALAQGLLTDKYLRRRRRRASGAGRPTFDAAVLTEQPGPGAGPQRDRRPARPDPGADGLCWVLRDPRVTTTLIGASSPEQVRENVAALANLDFSADELVEIDRYAVDAGVDLWKESSVL